MHGSGCERDMNKPIVIVSALLVAAVGSAAFLALKLQDERKRADSLAVRAFEHEPVEAGGRAAAKQSSAADPLHGPIPVPPATASDEPTPTADTPVIQQSVMDFPGSLRSRQWVARLQTRLSDGTPMQDYQIRALIETLDVLDKEWRPSPDERDLDEARRDQTIQAASDILFESQMDELVEMLREKGIGDRG